MFKNALPKNALGFHIQRRRQIVKNQKFGIANKHACGSSALNLSAGEFDTTRSNNRIQTVFKGGNIGLHDAIVKRVFECSWIIGQSQKNIIAQRLAEKTRNLRRISTARRRKKSFGIRDLLTIPVNIPTRKRKNTHKRSDKRGFSRANLPRNNRKRSSGNDEINIVNSIFRFGIGICHIANSECFQPVRFLTGWQTQFVGFSIEINICVLRDAFAGNIFNSICHSKIRNFGAFVVGENSPKQRTASGNLTDIGGKKCHIANRERTRLHFFRYENQYNARGNMPQIEIDRTEDLSKKIVDKSRYAARIIELPKAVDHMGLRGRNFDSENRLKHLIDKIGGSLCCYALRGAIFVNIIAGKIDNNNHAYRRDNRDKSNIGIDFRHIRNGECSKNEIAPHVDIAIEILNNAQYIVSKSVGHFARCGRNLSRVSNLENSSYKIFPQKRFNSIPPARPCKSRAKKGNAVANLNSDKKRDKRPGGEPRLGLTGERVKKTLHNNAREKGRNIVNTAKKYCG